MKKQNNNSRGLDKVTIMTIKHFIHMAVYARQNMIKAKARAERNGVSIYSIDYLMSNGSFISYRSAAKTTAEYRSF